MGKLDGRVALVTGAASGLGKASALLFAAEGAAVVFADINADGADSAAAEATDAGGQSLPLRIDVTSLADCHAAVAATLERFGRLDVVLTCAGIGDSAPIGELDAETFNRVLNVNVTGTFLTAKAAWDALGAQGGSFIALGSVAGVIGAPGFASYGASKAAVIHLMKIVAAEGASRIRANSICPSWVWTPMVRGGRAWIEVEGRLGERVREDVQPADLEVGTRVRVEQGGVEVDGEHRAAAADAVGEPAGDRPAAGAHLQAAPAGADAQAAQVLDGHRIAAALERVEPLGLTFPGLVEDVSRHAPPHLPPRRRRPGRVPPSIAEPPATGRRLQRGSIRGGAYLQPQWALLGLAVPHLLPLKVLGPVLPSSMRSNTALPVAVLPAKVLPLAPGPSKKMP